MKIIHRGCGSILITIYHLLINKHPHMVKKDILGKNLKLPTISRKNIGKTRRTSNPSPSACQIKTKCLTMELSS